MIRLHSMRDLVAGAAANAIAAQRIRRSAAELDAHPPPSPPRDRPEQLLCDAVQRRLSALGYRSVRSSKRSGAPEQSFGEELTAAIRRKVAAKYGSQVIKRTPSPR